MNIGNWDGGAGQPIRLSVKLNAEARERRAQARKLAAMIREAGLGSALINPDSYPDEDQDE